MSIVFHCQHCNKKIEAAETAGGKWGKCPACHNKIYVPDLRKDDDLKLAPIDESEEERKKRLMAETYRLQQDILKEREVPESAGPSSGPVPSIVSKDLEKQIIKYLRQMADGDLEQARRTALTIAPHRKDAVGIIDRIALSEIPKPELAKIPPQVLSGFIRSLRSDIS